MFIRMQNKGTVKIQQILQYKTRAGLLKTNDVVRERFVKVSNINIENKPFFVIKMPEASLDFPTKISVYLVIKS